MDEFGMLAKDFGFRPQGKSAPMRSGSGDRRGRPTTSSSTFAAEENDMFNGVFGGPPKYTNNNSKSSSSMSDFDYDSIFKDPGSAKNNESQTKHTSSNSLVYDKPLYDDDIFDGLPGVKSKPVSSPAAARYDDNVFVSMTTSSPKQSPQSDQFDDLLGNLGRTEKAESTRHHSDKNPRGLDDLIPGFGSSSAASSNRSSSKPSPKSTGKTKEKSNAIDDPFVVLESMTSPVTSSQGHYTDPLEDTKIGKSRSTKAGESVSGNVFGDMDSLNGFKKPAPAFAKGINNRGKGHIPSDEGSSMGSARSSVSREPIEESSFGYSENQPQKMPFDDLQESHQTVFDMPTVSRKSHRSFDQTTSPASYSETSSQVGTSPNSEEHVQHADDIWLTVSEVPLFTPVTRAPPPSRPPPPIPRHASKSDRGSFASRTRIFGNDLSSSSNSAKYSQNVRPFRSSTKSHVSSQLDDLENFAMGRMPNNSDGISDAQSGEEMDSDSASAAMKEAMDRAEAKFKHAKEVRERKHGNASRNREYVQVETDEQTMDEEITRGRLDRERQEREREEEEREQRRREKERIREIEREKARQAVERATREARERAASEARLKAERAAVQRAQAEARERAAIEARERAERGAAEAKERAAAEAKERASAEKAATESREKEAREKAAVARAEAEARRRAERAAVERVTAEARERAAAEARERAAAAAATKMNRQKNDNDLDSFFSMGSRPTSVPQSRAASSDSATDPLSQNRRGPDTGTSSNVRKASPPTNFVDDLSSIFGAATPAGEFQDVEGETEERRRARLERQQRTQERAAKALAEKNQRDMQSQREQEERQRISATLDIEIKRWAAGKEGNLRAMLSTLQYVLWPECGWQPVSLTDLITGASVKKAYRKATLCIHPDKVQQKGANLQQKYVAEKVFDLLKEAWNKFNSEELF
ncbi:auxilin-related protein 1-like isoform X1 [Cynara cardunculus var. scolymus]|uniref:DnaJ domain-containing protein n=1 Tax=Cynara cardunculus var. scolymus TaxID=59895 RepID=A0A103Y754_CYNCS|nr:auxilin-related protein 1-like isoform X1 [Cynara cardunculus var. scolymus]KVI03762.1 DnaJ domain-containing protein [Cynara cardunculus var. scolymus]